MVNKLTDIIDNISFIELLDVMGSDLTVVNAARASFQKHKAELDEKDETLINSLAVRHETSPFRHVYFTVRVKAPEFVARQWYKHIIGCQYAFVDQPWSESSQRYHEVAPEAYIPRVAREVDPNNKQGSVPCEDDFALWVMRRSIDDAIEDYQRLLRNGIAREMARMVLPLSIYTEWVWTCSLQAAVHFAALRDNNKAQWEIQQYACALRSLCLEYAPVAWETLETNHPSRLL